MAITTALRRALITRPILSIAAHAVPRLSATESEAIDAGDTWWDAELFTGDPDWEALLATPPARLTAEERAFLDGPVRTLCAMVDDWAVTQNRDLPPQVWAYLKEQRFFGMIIPRDYGGLGFSAFAHSEVVRMLATRSISAAVTAMVPNSLGPGELLMRFGTEEQRNRWLPRLASGQDIPCFGLTSAEGGSDAGAMVDHGVVTYGEWEGERVLGMRLNWAKRYITLAPVSTLLGLAFKLRDPDGLLGAREDLGITLALIPTDLPGVTIGRRHWPAMQSFQNGPTQGHDVFVPLSHVIGGAERIGQGWRMLMSALAAGRGISLPSLSAAAAGFCVQTAGAYARVREQFGLPIAKFEGVQERLARIAGNAYLLDAARRMTCAALDAGHHPAVIASIMKLHATERMRTVVNDAMDIHGGKGIIEGPKNYLGDKYRGIPVAITVEGANILTRSLMVYGQGAIRAHPYLLQEIRALADARDARALERFDEVFWQHLGHALKTAWRATSRAWTGGAFAPAPGVGTVRWHYRKLGRYSAAFAFLSDIAFLTLGGELKRRELLSARFGDILSELYLLSAALKRWDEEGRQAADRPVLDYVMAQGFSTIEVRLDEILANLPYPPLTLLLRALILPLGPLKRGADDALVRQVAVLATSPGGTRERLIGGCYDGDDGEVGLLLSAYRAVTQAQPIRDRLKKEGVRDWRQAQLPDGERALLEEAARLSAEVIAVDDFAVEALLPSAQARLEAAE